MVLNVEPGVYTPGKEAVEVNAVVFAGFIRINISRLTLRIISGGGHHAQYLARFIVINANGPLAIAQRIQRGCAELPR